MTDDESKKIILARRARFIAAALASVGLASATSCISDKAQACLVPPLVEDPDAGEETDASSDADAGPEGSG